MSAGSRLSVLARWIHHAYAALRAFFWIPCPLCGRKFGGHEWRDRDGYPSLIPKPEPAEGGSYTAICPACTRAGLGFPGPR